MPLLSIEDDKIGWLSGPCYSPPPHKLPERRSDGFCEAACSAIDVVAETAFCSFYIPSVSASWILAQTRCPLTLLISRFQFIFFFPLLRPSPSELLVLWGSREDLQLAKLMPVTQGLSPDKLHPQSQCHLHKGATSFQTGQIGPLPT